MVLMWGMSELAFATRKHRYVANDRITKRRDKMHYRRDKGALLVLKSLARHRS